MGTQVERPWTLPEVAGAAGLPYRTLHGWLERGVISPTFRSSSGSGKPNLFSADDARSARILGDLRRAGLGLDALTVVSAELRRHRANLRDTDVLLVNGSVRILSETEQLAAVLDRPAPALLYRVGWASEAIRTFVAADCQ